MSTTRKSSKTWLSFIMLMLSIQSINLFMSMLLEIRYITKLAEVTSVT